MKRCVTRSHNPIRRSRRADDPISAQKHGLSDIEKSCRIIKSNNSRHAAIRAHYLSLPGKTEDGWKEVAKDPAKFNRVWNHMLGLPPNDKPPNLEKRRK